MQTGSFAPLAGLLSFRVIYIFSFYYHYQMSFYVLVFLNYRTQRDRDTVQNLLKKHEVKDLPSAHHGEDQPTYLFHQVSLYVLNAM